MIFWAAPCQHDVGQRTNIKHLALGGSGPWQQLRGEEFVNLTSLSIFGVLHNVRLDDMFAEVLHNLRHVSLSYRPHWRPDGDDARSLSTWINRLLPSCPRLYDLRLDIVTITPWLELTIRNVPLGIRHWTIVLRPWPDDERASIIDLGLLFSRLILGELARGGMPQMERLAVVDGKDRSLHRMVSPELTRELDRRCVRLAKEFSEWRPWESDTSSHARSFRLSSCGSHG